MTTTLDLLSLILDPANFADDGLRLAYADLLEEEGDIKRSEFIYTQVKVAQMNEAGEGVIDSHEGHTCVLTPCPVCAEVEKYNRLKLREQELLDTRDRFGTPNKFTWFTPVPSAALFGWEYEFHRGFVCKVRCKLEDWYGDQGKVGCDFCLPDNGGQRWVGSPDQCPKCHGKTKNTIKGYGPAIVRQQPIEYVGVTNKSPLMSSDQVARWTNDRRREQDYNRWHLPYDVFALLPTEAGANCRLIRNEGEFRYSFSLRDYDTEADANNVLSVALLLWARQQEVTT